MDARVAQVAVALDHIARCGNLPKHVSRLAFTWLRHGATVEQAIALATRGINLCRKRVNPNCLRYRPRLFDASYRGGRARTPKQMLTRLENLKAAHSEQGQAKWWLMRYGHLKLLRPCDA